MTFCLCPAPCVNCFHVFIPSSLSSFITRLYDVCTSQSLLGRYISLVPFLQPKGCPLPPPPRGLSRMSHSGYSHHAHRFPAPPPTLTLPLPISQISGHIEIPTHPSIAIRNSLSSKTMSPISY